MLRISHPVLANSQDFLFSPPNTDGYFLSHWLGHGAKELGLEGSVGRGEVRALLEGRLTGGTQQTGGMNLCFTSPASLSVLWSQLEKDHRRTIQAINNEAVRNAISYLQDEARLIHSRLEPHTRQEVGFVGALFARGISQTQSPELQSHVVLSNSCLRSDGSFGTLDPVRLLKLKSAAEAIFRLSLSHGLQTQLGLRLVRNADSLEIAGVPSIESWGPSPNSGPSNKVVADASITTGPGIPETPTNTFGRWQEIGRQHGWGPDQASQLLALDQRIETYLSPHEVFAAAEALRAPFELHELVRALATHFQTSTVSYSGLQGAINREVYGFETVKSHGGETMYQCGIRPVRDPVSPRESNHRAVDDAHRLPKQSVEAQLKSSALTEHQKAAFRFVTTSPGTTKALCNFGETERWTLMAMAQKQWTAAGFRVVGICGHAERAAQFQDSTSIATVTAGQALGQTSPSKKSLTQRASTSIRNGVDTATARARNVLRLVRLPPPVLNVGGSPVDQRCVVVAEDAHTIGRTQLKMLQDRCAQAGAKLVVLGNAEQLGSIPQREMFRSKYAPISQSPEGKGQKGPGSEPRKHNGNDSPSRALSELALGSNVHVSGVNSSAQNMLLTGWGKWRDPKNNLILTQTVAEADALNALAQANCRQRGLLGNRQITHGRQTFHSGDRVLFEKSSKELGVSCGGFGTVAALCKGWISVRLDDTNQRVEIPLHKYKDVKLGYAVPHDRARGSLAENAHVLVSSSQQAKEMGYLKDSRAFVRTEFYLHRGKTNEESIALRRGYELEIKQVESMPRKAAWTKSQPSAEVEQRPGQSVDGVSGAPLANGNGRPHETRSSTPSKGQTTTNGQSSSKSQSQSQGR